MEMPVGTGRVWLAGRNGWNLFCATVNCWNKHPHIPTHLISNLISYILLFFFSFFGRLRIKTCCIMIQVCNIICIVIVHRFLRVVVPSGTVTPYPFAVVMPWFTSWYEHKHHQSPQPCLKYLPCSSKSNRIFGLIKNIISHSFPQNVFLCILESTVWRKHQLLLKELSVFIVTLKLTTNDL